MSATSIRADHIPAGVYNVDPTAGGRQRGRALQRLRRAHRSRDTRPLGELVENLIAHHRHFAAVA
jgi:hypothetical protein